MNKLIMGIGAAIFIIAGIVFIARPDTSQNNNTANISEGFTGTIEIPEKTFDFGKISMAAGKVSHSFTIKNIGDKPITVNKIYTSCMCTTATLKINGKIFGPYGMQGHGAIPKINQELGSGEEAIVEATFDPAAHGPAGVGSIERSMVIENSAGKPIQLDFAADVVP